MTRNKIHLIGYSGPPFTVGYVDANCWSNTLLAYKWSDSV